MVGIDRFHEHKVREYAIETLLRSGDFLEQVKDMERGMPVVLEGLPSDSFRKILECMYADYYPDCGTAVVSILPPRDLIKLYPAARFFRLDDLATAILEALETSKCPDDVFWAGQDIYAHNGADQSFRVLFRKQLALLFDRMSTNSERWAERVNRSKIIRVLLDSHATETCRQDILEVILERGIGCNGMQDEQSSVSQSGKSRGALFHSPASRSDKPAVWESTSEHGQEDEPNNDADRERFRQTNNQSGLSAIAIKDHDGWNENFRFRIGDRISKIVSFAKSTS